jgi:hypothetical protein
MLVDPRSAVLLCYFSYLLFVGLFQRQGRERKKTDMKETKVLSVYKVDEKLSREERPQWTS